MALTVSERAHRLTQLNPNLSWKDAMKQAWEEIVLPKLEQEEEDAKQNLDVLENKARNANTGDFILGDVLNNAVGDIIITLEDKYIDAPITKAEKEGGRRYPYSRAWRRITGKSGAGDVNIEDEIGGKATTSGTIDVSEIQSLIYDYTKKDEWDAQYRTEDGRISNTWWNEFSTIVQKLKLDTSRIDGYEEAKAIFI